MAQTHFISKRKRRPISGRRQDTARVAAFSAWCKANPIGKPSLFSSTKPYNEALELDVVYPGKDRSARQTLRELGKWVWSADYELMTKVGEFLADYITQRRLVPMGFVMACNLAKYDIQNGVNGRTGEQIIFGEDYPPVLYSLIAMSLNIAEIAEACFPPEYANAVKKFVAEVEAKLAAAGH